MLKTVQIYKYKNNRKMLAGPIYGGYFQALNSDLTFSSQRPHRVKRNTILETTSYKMEIRIEHENETTNFQLIRIWDERRLSQKTQDLLSPVEERIDITPAHEFNDAEKLYTGERNDHPIGNLLLFSSFVLIWFVELISWWPALLSLLIGLLINWKASTEGDPTKILEIKEAKQRLRDKSEALFRAAIQDINAWKKLDGIGFENAVSKVFRDQGYIVRHTPRSNDKGIDLILERDSHKIIVQCKAYAKNVGVSAVRELHGSRYQFPDASKVMLVS